MEKDLLKLINASKDFAEKLLIDYKEFYPFGAIIDTSGKAKTVAYSKDDNDFPESLTIINGLTKHLDKRLNENDILAYAIVYDAYIKEKGMDAICIQLKHRESIENLTCYYCYKINTEGALTYYEAWSERSN